MKLPVYSYTFLSTWDICPKQAFHRYVVKDIPFVETAQMKWGNVVHKALEQRIGKGTPLPAETAQYEFYAAALTPLKPEVEIKLGIKRDGSACAFFDDDVWLRGKADVAARQGETAVLFDWKTGKKREDGYELELQALMLSAIWPELARITGHYIWLAERAIGRPHDLTNVGETLDCLREKTDEIEQMNRTGLWPTKPGPLCGWCAVKSCGFNRSGK